MYDREINSISRLTAAVEAVEELNADEGTDDAVIIDLYVKDGESTFICVQDVAESTEEEEIEEDYEFDDLRANFKDTSTSLYTGIEFTEASNSELASWNLGNVEVEYVVYVDGTKLGTYTQTIGDVSMSSLADEMSVDGLRVSVNNPHEVSVEVTVMFNGTSDDDTDSVYTISGTASFDSL